MGSENETEDPLHKFRYDEEAFGLIRELYNVSDEVAIELWHRFLGTVERMKFIGNPQEPGTGREEAVK
jgi:hypothetical protein